MKNLLKKATTLVVGFALALVTIGTLSRLAAPTEGQAQPTGVATFLDPVFRTLSVLPAKSSNGTNAFAVYTKYPTNYFRIEPTNGNLQMRVPGSTTLWTGVTAVVQFGGQGTNLNGFSSFLTNMTFKNGILVGGP